MQMHWWPTLPSYRHNPNIRFILTDRFTSRDRLSAGKHTPNPQDAHLRPLEHQRRRKTGTWASRPTGLEPTQTLVQRGPCVDEKQRPWSCGQRMPTQSIGNAPENEKSVAPATLFKVRPIANHFAVGCVFFQYWNAARMSFKCIQ